MEVYTKCIILLFFGDTCCRTLSCPSGCTCNNVTPGRVICRSGIRGFPLGLDIGTAAIVLIGKPRSPNSISHLGRTDISQFTKLIEIYITFSGLTNVEDKTFENAAKLRRINLKYNAISKISRLTFYGLAQLEELDLTGNRGCVIETGSFSSLTSLLHLFLADMKLTYLEKGIFLGLSSLLTLDLHGNALTEISADLFISTTSLTSLDLSSNRLIKLSKSFAVLLNNTHANLEDNPWHCNCEIQWIKTVFAYSLNHFPASGDPVVCYTPKNLRYSTLVRVPNDKMKCHPPTINHCDGPFKVGFRKQLKITCLVEGDPFPDFFWIKPDKSKTTLAPTNQTSSAEYETSRSVTFDLKDALLKDDGVWSVSAKNKYGQKLKTFRVHVVGPTTTTTTTTTKPVTSPKTTRTKRIKEKLSPGFLAAAVGFGFTTLVACFMCLCTARYIRKRNRTTPNNNSPPKDGHVDDITVVVPKRRI